MTIGKVNDKAVKYSEVNKSVRISNTDILLVGVKSKDEAIERCKINFKDYKEA